MLEYMKVYETKFATLSIIQFIPISVCELGKENNQVQY